MLKYVDKIVQVVADDDALGLCSVNVRAFQNAYGDDKRTWELNLEDLGARIVVPSGFKACEKVQET